MLILHYWFYTGAIFLLEKYNDNISNLTFEKLWDMHRLHGLPREGVKLILITWITNYLDIVVLLTINDKEIIYKNIAEDSAGFVS